MFQRHPGHLLETFVCIRHRGPWRTLLGWPHERYAVLPPTVSMEYVQPHCHHLSEPEGSRYLRFCLCRRNCSSSNLTRVTGHTHDIIPSFPVSAHRHSYAIPCSPFSHLPLRPSSRFVSPRLSFAASPFASAHFKRRRR